jgi:hypothetical protein
MTALPAVRFPEMPVASAPADWRLVYGWFASDPPPDGPADGAQSFHEIHLQLENLDLDDERALLNFVRQHGILGMYKAHGHEKPDPGRPGLYTLSQTGSKGWLPGPRMPVEPLRDGRSAGALPAIFDGLEASRFHGLPDYYLGAGLYEHRIACEYWSTTQVPETLAEFRFGASLVADLVRAWQTVKAAGDALPREAGVRPRARSGGRGNLEDAAAFLRKHLTDALVPWSPQVVGAWVLVDSDTGLVVGEPPPVVRPVSLFQHACVQLFNHIQENATLRRCHNDTCGRWYVRQTGRADHGQHWTTGTKYCTKICANAQLKRESRQKARDAASSARPEP